MNKYLARTLFVVTLLLAYGSTWLIKIQANGLWPFYSVPPPSYYKIPAHLGDPHTVGVRLGLVITGATIWIVVVSIVILILFVAMGELWHAGWRQTDRKNQKPYDGPDRRKRPGTPEDRGKV